jgi:hypothetical protein
MCCRMLCNPQYVRHWCSNGQYFAICIDAVVIAVCACVVHNDMHRFSAHG